MRLPVSLKLRTWIMTETASMTKTPPTTTSNNSCLQQIATTPIRPPIASEPVSPMKTLAGWQLNQRNPKPAPLSAAQTTVRSTAFDDPTITSTKNRIVNQPMFVTTGDLKNGT